ncbi:MAG: hypothetical protein ACRDTT_04540 [Pseudonocardiaceae bacterium]
MDVGRVLPDLIRQRPAFGAGEDRNSPQEGKTSMLRMAAAHGFRVGRVTSMRRAPCRSD